MRQIVFSKRLNNTELGKGNTHETYVLVPSNVSIDNIFEVENKQYDFCDVSTNTIYKIRKTQGNETRLVGLGDYYREKNLNAGDMVIFTFISNDEKRFYIDYMRNDKSIIFQKNTNGFEILTPNRISLSDAIPDDELEIRFIASKKKRSDSPRETDFYDIISSGKSLLNDYKNNELGEISFEKSFVIKKYISYKIFDLEEIENE